MLTINLESGARVRGRGTQACPCGDAYRAASSGPTDVHSGLRRPSPRGDRGRTPHSGCARERHAYRAHSDAEVFALDSADRLLASARDLALRACIGSAARTRVVSDFDSRLLAQRLNACFAARRQAARRKPSFSFSREADQGKSKHLYATSHDIHRVAQKRASVFDFTAKIAKCDCVSSMLFIFIGRIGVVGMMYCSLESSAISGKLLSKEYGYHQPSSSE